MAVELFNDGKHIVHAFYDLVNDSAAGAVQCNQFLIADHGHGALIDPGGNMTYGGLLMDMQQYFSSKDLDYILASHPDPDIIASALGDVARARNMSQLARDTASRATD